MSVYGDKKKGTRILSWRVACYYTDWTGERKKHEKRGFATKAEAKEYEHEFLAKKSRDTKMEFSTFLDQYLEDLKPRIKMSTMETKISQIDKHIRPFFGKRCLSEINSTHFMWVELGLQTIHPASARYIRRGYELPVYDECVRRLRGKGITVIVHIILGLPGETTEDMKETVRYVCASGVQGIKLQLLHILKGTDLYGDYLQGKVPVMSMEEYLDLLKELLPMIPDDVVIHRLTGDGPKRLLVAPLWTADKKKVINAISGLISAPAP